MPRLHFYGQSAFQLVGDDGMSIVIDPYTTTERIRYQDDFDAADLVMVTHEHGDHNNVEAVPGSHEIVRGPGDHSAAGIDIRGIASFHDKQQGAQRGPNTIFIFDFDGLRFAHFGDQGVELEEAQFAELQGINVMIAPVGGGPTLEPDLIWQVAERIQPNVFIPVHFKTDKIDVPVQPLEDFLQGKTSVRRDAGSDVELRADDLPDPITIIALEPSR
jgi:L-ascorbate metabolism protein UlaG (beta-lactamase superfamily)